MKKIITIVVSVLLLIPFVVKADMIKPDIFYNKNTSIKTIKKLEFSF